MNKYFSELQWGRSTRDDKIVVMEEGTIGDE